MVSSLISAILLLSLAVTSACVLALHRRLKLLSRYHEEHGRMLEKGVAALGTTREAVALFSVESRTVLHALGSKVDEAKALLSDLDQRHQDLSGSRPVATNITVRRLAPQDLANQDTTPMIVP